MVPPATNADVFSKDISAAFQRRIKTSIQYSKEMLTYELGKENKANAGNAIAPLDKNREIQKIN